MIFNNEPELNISENLPENTALQQSNNPENIEKENLQPAKTEVLPYFTENADTETPEIVEKPSTETANSVKNTMPTVKKTANTVNANTRLTITTSFVQNEVEHLKHIIASRIEAGITRDNSHFIRQCVDFAVNSSFVFKENRFGLPENTQKLFLKDAFFNNKK